MDTQQLVSIATFCKHEEVELAFVHSLHERGLIEVVVQDEVPYIAPDHLPRLEQLARLHYQLDINLEGIEALSHLLERVERMQEDVRILRERLRLYEDQ
ncbi:MAG: MerR family transcriptional regulator [Flavobacteriales bacterium]|nr:MerR family transcriptional regulator [Flavobacteriales bacterium]